MQLPYPTPLPGWTRSGHPCVTSRPFLTMHASQYLSRPRLFPISLSARQVYPGTGSAFPMQSKDNAYPEVGKCPESSEMASIPSGILSLAASGDTSRQTDASKRRVPYPMEGNPACVLREGEDNYVALTPSGLLSDVSFFHADISENRDSEYFEFSGGSSGPCIVLAKEDGQVLQLVATDRDPGSAERGLIAARMRDCFYVGCFQKYAENLNWTDRVALEASCVIAVNSVAKNEIAALDSSALSVFDVEHASRAVSPTEIQPLHPRSLYRWLRYGSHPRTLYLANALGVGFIDLRCLPGAEKDITVLDPLIHWSLCCEDSGICFFDRHPRHPFQSVLVTSTLLSIIDSRMLRQPLLEWNMHSSQRHLSGAIAAFDNPGKTSDECDLVIALSSAASSDLWVFHAAQGCELASEVVAPPSTATTLHDLTFQHPQLLWSDMPLEHLDRFGSRHEVRGIALIPYQEKRRLSVVQSSVHGGAISQLLGCEPFADGAHVFQRTEDHDDGADPPTLLDGIDSFANILNARDMMATEKLLHGDEEDQEALEKHFQKDFNPGLNTLKRLACLDARDARHLRRRIYRGDDDAHGTFGKLTIPRGFVSDLKVSKDDSDDKDDDG